MYMIHYIIFYIVKFSVDRRFSVFIKWKTYTRFQIRIIEQYLHCIFFVKRFALLRFNLIERKGIEWWYFEGTANHVSCWLIWDALNDNVFWIPFNQKWLINHWILTFGNKLKRQLIDNYTYTYWYNIENLPRL